MNDSENIGSKAILITSNDINTTNTDIDLLKNLLDKVIPEAAERLMVGFAVTVIDDIEDLFLPKINS